MCAINPKHEAHLTLSVYTSHDIDAATFTELVLEKILEVEQQLNSDARLRWHVNGDL